MEEVEKVQQALADLEARHGALPPRGAPHGAAPGALDASRGADWLEQLDRELAERLAGTHGGQAPFTGVTDLSVALLETLKLARQIVVDIRDAQGAQQDQRRQELEAELTRLEDRAAALRQEADQVVEQLEAVRNELATLEDGSDDSSNGRP